MDSSAFPPSTRTTATGGHGGSRSLHEPVLSSAEEELDVDRGEPAGTETVPPARGAGGDWWPQMQDRLGRWVGERPGQAALVALGAGALAAVVLGQGLRGRRRRD